MRQGKIMCGDDWDWQDWTVLVGMVLVVLYIVLLYLTAHGYV